MEPDAWGGESVGGDGEVGMSFVLGGGEVRWWKRVLGHFEALMVAVSTELYKAFFFLLDLYPQRFLGPQISTIATNKSILML